MSVQGGLGGAQEVAGGHAGNLDRILHGQEEPGLGPLVHAQSGELDAVEGGRTRGDRVLGVARQRVGHGRFAGAVGAHDGVNLTGLDGQVHPVQDRLGTRFGLDIDMQVGDDKVCHGDSVLLVSGRVVDVDEDLIAVDDTGIDGHRQYGRQVECSTGA